MDIYCTRCGEPWDNDTFHDVAAEQKITYKQAIARFRDEGCAGTGWCDPCQPVNTLRTSATAMLHDILGDDIDGIASLLEDFEYFRLLD
jgi:hypothetical protein